MSKFIVLSDQVYPLPLATELRELADTKNAKLFHGGLKTIYGPQANGSSSILSADADTRLTEPSRIRERWAEHFSDVLNRSSTISQAAIDNIARRRLMDELAYRVQYRSTLDETILQQSRNFPFEKQQDQMRLLPTCSTRPCGGINLTKSLVKLFNNFFDNMAVPQQFKDATIVHIYKRKGGKSTSVSVHNNVYKVIDTGYDKLNGGNVECERSTTV